MPGTQSGSARDAGTSQDGAGPPASGGWRSPVPAANPPDLWLRLARTVRLSGAAILLALVLWGLARYPLSPLILAGALAVYAALLWYRPGTWLWVLPVVLPSWDLGIWTGWMMLGEADFFIAVTLAVLLIRTTPASLPPARPFFSGLAGAVLLGFTACWLIATLTGLCGPLGAAYSDNAFLRPDNALRLAKALAEALALLPFLRRRQLTHADAVSRLGAGMAAGLVAVALIVLAERALFAGIWDFSAEYRVAGPFSSMRVGGGHIGAYAVLALPMALTLTGLRPRWLSVLLLPVWLLGGYTLAVTFARTGYAAGMVAISVACMAWRRSAGRRLPRLALVAVLAVPAGLAAAAATGGMRARLAESLPDFAVRRQNWDAGLAVRDTGALADLFGMGLGTYQRAMLERSPGNRPSDLVLGHDAAQKYVSIRVESRFFLGQKIRLPATGDLHLALRARGGETATTLSVALCDKVLLYSDNCRGGAVVLAPPGAWQAVTLVLPVAGLGGSAALGLLQRPVELALFGAPPGHHVDIADVRLTDDTGRAALANGDFSRGLDRWIFTDDDHVAWRMLNQYLMLWFETGALGLAAFLALCALAIAGGLRAAWRGSVAGAAVAGSLCGFLVCGLFDNVLEAPRLATLFFLVCLCGLLQWEQPTLCSD